MTQRIGLVALRVIGAVAESAAVDLENQVTVISGPTDTGKSYVFDLLDYAFGASTLRQIPEALPYRHVALWLRLDGDPVTLIRPLEGGKFLLANGFHKSLSDFSKAEKLSERHSATSEDNVSAWLLRAVGLRDKHVRVNQEGKTRSVSFRDVAHLTLVGETRMQAPANPIEPTDQYTARTVEQSVFRLLLTGEGDEEVKVARKKSGTSKAREQRSVVLTKL